MSTSALWDKIQRISSLADKYAHHKVIIQGDDLVLGSTFLSIKWDKILKITMGVIPHNKTTLE